MTIFGKMIILIGMLLLPILLLYSWSNYISVKVVEQTLKDANNGQLAFFVNQVDATVQRLSASAIYLNKDWDIVRYRSDEPGAGAFGRNVVSMEEIIMQKLSTQSLFANWGSEFSVFFPEQRKVISTNPVMMYDGALLQAHVKSGWQAGNVFVNGHHEFAFSYYEVYPFTTSGNIAEAHHMVGVRIYERNIRAALNQFKADSIRDPFLVHPEYGLIGGSSVNSAISEELTARMRNMVLDVSGVMEQTIEGKKYLITYIQSKQLGWYVVDYVPIQKILSPITESRNYFYLCVAFLIILAVLSVLLLYRHVQVPIRELVHGVRRIEKGNYSSRMRLNTSSEFVFLFNSFNRMAEQIENLIETVLLEKIRSRDAVLKQLQSQINPHFLFNCFAFIMSMAKTKNFEAILSMAHSLSKYYRFTTRTEVFSCTLREELDFVRCYLDIQQMRMARIRYHIHIEESMLELRIPRLLLQPLIENAIVHGVEPDPLAGLIQITGELAEDGYWILIDDDGGGLARTEMDALTKRMEGPLLKEMGCGIWNVNQRLKLHFAEGSGMQFAASPDGGLRIIMKLIVEPEAYASGRSESNVSYDLYR